MLEKIKKSIFDENISYSEILWLQEHKKKVLEDGDIALCKRAGISEEEYGKRTES